MPVAGQVGTVWDRLQVEWSGSGLRDYHQAAAREWLVTNGLGGYAGGTVAGANTRRYHGLLIAAVQPPVERMLVMAGLEEYLVVAGERRPLSTSRYAGAIHPAGYQHLWFYRTLPFPTFVFRVAGCLLTRTVFMVWGQNVTVVVYRLLDGPDEVGLELIPLLNCRDHHHVTQETDWPWSTEIHQLTNGSTGIATAAYPGAPPLWLGVTGHPGASEARGTLFVPRPDWYRDFYAAVEHERGLETREDHFSPGRFHASLQLHAATAVVICCPLGGGPATPPGEAVPTSPEAFFAPECLGLDYVEQLWSGAVARREALIHRTGLSDPRVARLVPATDDFLVRRPREGRYTVMAGYPWFTDWGRDAMIALPGLTLITHRFDAARDTLSTFAHHRRDGILPNRFPDHGVHPEYNSVDASLWFAYAAWAYLQYSGDAGFAADVIYPAVRDILEAYRQGTHFGIGMGPDGLLAAGESGQQLTWMDARVDGWVVTPRYGMPVEVNALWYNALRVGESLARSFDPSQALVWGRVAAAVLETFPRRFIHPDGYLFDVVGKEPDPALRPNQIFALSLPFPLISGMHARRILDVVGRELVTPFGLRSVALSHPAYAARYEGTQYQRDGAYHQGTVWPWLMGPYVTAYVRCHGAGSAVRQRGRDLLAPLLGQVYEGCLGTVAEIFDGDAPHQPRGCPAQAWSVAELLRAWVEDVEGRRPVGQASLASTATLAASSPAASSVERG